MSDKTFFVWVHGTPKPILQRGEDANAALKAAQAVFRMDPTDPLAQVALIAAENEARNALALLAEFNLEPV